MRFVSKIITSAGILKDKVRRIANRFHKINSTFHFSMLDHLKQLQTDMEVQVVEIRSVQIHSKVQIIQIHSVVGVVGVVESSAMVQVQIHSMLIHSNSITRYIRDSNPFSTDGCEDIFDRSSISQRDLSLPPHRLHDPSSFSCCFSSSPSNISPLPNGDNPLVRFHAEFILYIVFSLSQSVFRLCDTCKCRSWKS